MTYFEQFSATFPVNHEILGGRFLGDDYVKTNTIEARKNV